MPRRLHILILAAGASSRMQGRDKLMEPVAGQSLLARIADQACQTGLSVTVVLPPDRPERRTALAGLRVAQVTADRARDGMAESLKAGLSQLPQDEDVMVLLADLPELETADLVQMAKAWESHPETILRAASASGQPGHPVIFPAALRPALMALDGDQGARAILAATKAPILSVPLAGDHAIIDLDTPEAWAAWRQSRPA